MRRFQLTIYAARAIAIWLGLVLCLLAGPGAAAQQLLVAAAADLQFAMQDLAPRYQSQSGQSLALSYGSSGNLLTQIENGAPFDLFFSADSTYPQKLVDAGLAERHSFCFYALGRLVLWTAPDSQLHVAERGLSVLLDPRVHKIAIANPDHAPYGKAALATLQKTGVYEHVKSKLVFGENISQAAQFVQSGNAEVGFVALSLALSPAMAKGERMIVPAEFYPPLQQAAVVISSSKNKQAALKFLDFVKSDLGREILANYGFTMSPTPDPAGARP